MIEVKIKISRDKVYDLVAAETVYVGGRSAIASEDGAYDRLFVTDDDRAQLDGFFRDACSNANSFFAEWLKSESSPDVNPATRKTDYTATLELPDNADNISLGTMSNDLYSFFTSTIMASWLQMLGVESASAYVESAKAAVESLTAKLNRRVRPTYVKSVNQNRQ